MSKLKLPVIPDDAIITLEISGYFYKQLQQLLLATAQTKTPEDLKKVLLKIKENNKYEDIFEAQIHTLTSLITSIEQAAKDQGKVEVIDFDPELSNNQVS